MSSSFNSFLTSSPENELDFFNTKYPLIEEFGNKQLKAFWLPTDVSYENDRRDYLTLDPSIQHLIERTLGFFFASDGIVFKNLGDNFKNDFKLPEIKYTYSAFETMELIHAKSYGLQLESIITNDTKKKELMNAISTIPTIKAKADWAFKYMDSSKYNLLERMIAFLCVEGIFFSSSFATIFWIRKYYSKKFRGITGANDLISRDENLHCEFAVYLIRLLLEENSSLKTSSLTNIIQEAVEIEINFVNDNIPEGMIDMNKDLMSSYVRYVANRWSTLALKEKIGRAHV